MIWWLLGHWGDAEKSQISHSRRCFTPTLALNAPRLLRTPGELNLGPPELLGPNPQLCHAKTRNVFQDTNSTDSEYPVPKLLIMTAALKASFSYLTLPENGLLWSQTANYHCKGIKLVKICLWYNCSLSQTACIGTLLCLVYLACDDRGMTVIFKCVFKVWLLDLTGDHPWVSELPR